MRKLVNDRNNCHKLHVCVPQVTVVYTWSHLYTHLFTSAASLSCHKRHQSMLDMEIIDAKVWSPIANIQASSHIQNSSEQDTRGRRNLPNIKRPSKTLFMTAWAAWLVSVICFAWALSEWPTTLLRSKVVMATSIIVITFFARYRPEDLFTETALSSLASQTRRCRGGGGSQTGVFTLHVRFD